MDVFIQSRGQGLDHDYTWVAVQSGELFDLQYFPFYQNGIAALIDPDAFALTIGRYDEQYVLFVGSLSVASDRLDFQHRPVKNAILCITSASEESSIRGIAVASLQGILAGLLNRFVAFDSTNLVGFRVSQELVEALQSLRASGNAAPTVDARIAKNTDGMRSALVTELEHAMLPNREGTLVVVTRYKEAQQFVSAGIWRGLSLLVDADTPDSLSEWHPIKNNGQRVYPTSLILITALLLVLVLVITAISLLFN